MEDEELEMIDSMLSNDKMHLLSDVINQEDDEEEEEEQPKTVYKLFEYLRKDFLDKMRLDYNEIYQTFCERAQPLVEDLVEDKPIIEEIIDTFLSLMVLTMITEDKVAFKVQDEMLNALYEMYDHREKVLPLDRANKENKKKKKEKEPVLRVKNDFAHYDRCNAEIAERCIAQRDPATDLIEIEFSKAKKRGRHNKSHNDLVTNAVETLAGELIERRQSLNHANATQAKSANDSLSSPCHSPNGQKPNTINYYPIFKETLEIFNRCIPKAKNHGFYLRRLIQFIRTLDSHVWPLHGLMSLANNMNYCVHAETVKMQFDRTARRFYCCYSGLEIENGETVTCLRVVENNALRLKEWRDNPPSNRKPYEMPEFIRSVGAFYLKKALCCPSTLFFSEFSARYKSQFPDYFDTTSPSPLLSPPTLVKKRKAPIVTLTSNKKVKVEPDLFDSLRPNPKEESSPLRVMMRYIDDFLEESDSVWYAYKGYEEKYRKNYAEEKQQISNLLDKMNKKTFMADMKQLAFYAILSSPSLNNCAQEETEQVALIDICIDMMLDFIEALVVPERKFDAFAAAQKTRMMRAITSHVQQRIKRRKLLPNPFLLKTANLKETTREMMNIHWLICCPLLFIILFNYLAKEDATGLLRQTNKDEYNCKILIDAFELTQI